MSDEKDEAAEQVLLAAAKIDYEVRHSLSPALEAYGRMVRIKGPGIGISAREEALLAASREMRTLLASIEQYGGGVLGAKNGGVAATLKRATDAIEQYMHERAQPSVFPPVSAKEIEDAMARATRERRAAQDPTRPLIPAPSRPPIVAPSDPPKRPAVTCVCEFHDGISAEEAAKTLRPCALHDAWMRACVKAERADFDKSIPTRIFEYEGKKVPDGEGEPSTVVLMIDAELAKYKDWLTERFKKPSPKYPFRPGQKVKVADRPHTFVGYHLDPQSEEVLAIVADPFGSRTIVPSKAITPEPEPGTEL